MWLHLNQKTMNLVSRKRGRETKLWGQTSIEQGSVTYKISLSALDGKASLAKEVLLICAALCWQSPSAAVVGLYFIKFLW